MTVALVTQASAQQIKTGIRRYRPHGAIRDLWAYRDHEIIVAGPADTGKSLGALWKLHGSALEYPGARILIVRKTRASLTESGLVTFEQKVLPPGSSLASNMQREQRHSYKYPNGSEIVVGGLDDPIRVMSSEYDLIYAQECRELTENEWEHLCTRASGRAGNMPYAQVIGDTNPDAPRHWIKLRANRGQLKLLESRHEDNPSMTPERMAVLDNLTGVRFKRLRLGLWVAAEGIVYEGWDPAIHVVDRFDIPADWPRYLAVDFGYTNPFVCQWWAQDPDGRLYRYRELYQAQGLVEDHAHAIRRLSQGERIRAIICDHDAEDRATLERHLSCQCADLRVDVRVPGTSDAIRVGTTAARKDVSPGLQAVAQRLKPAGDSRVRLSYLRDSLVLRDATLDEAKKPCSTEEEFEGYIWDQATAKVNPDGSYRAELPVKKDDHGLDGTRYMVAYFDLKDPRDALYGQAHGLNYGGHAKPNMNPDVPMDFEHKGVKLLLPKVDWDRV